MKNLQSSLLLFVSLSLLLVGAAAALPASSRVRDLTRHGGDVPRRLVGYGIVVGLDGTGDRSFGGISSRNATVTSVVNLLRRFDVEIPPDYLRLRNVAAVLVTAEVSPYLRAGGRFEVQVSAIGDATSLDGGSLWITPLVTDPDQPPLATAQGTILVHREDQTYASRFRQSNSGRIPEGGLLEADPPRPEGDALLLLRRPDRMTARLVADRINRAFGDGTAKVEDTGAIALTIAEADAETVLASIDTLSVSVEGPARVVIHGQEGTVVAGGDIRVSSAVINHRGITLQIGGGAPPSGQATPGLVRVEPEALVQDIAAGLHAAGARPTEIAAIFEALRDAGALRAEVVIR